MPSQAEIRPLPPGASLTETVQRLNQEIYLRRGDSPGYVNLVGYDGTKTNQDATVASSGNAALHIKPAAGVPSILAESSAAVQLLSVTDSGVTTAVGMSGVSLALTTFLTAGTFVAVGTNPASAGPIRLANATAINARNAANSANVAMVQTNSSNHVLLGDTTTAPSTYVQAATDVRLKVGVTELGVLTVANGLRLAAPLSFDTDATYDIGASTTTFRPRNGFFSGNGVFGGSLTTGGQIVFPAVQNASGSANVLDDYEEGTWSPTTGATAESNTGNYIKVGRIVVAWFTVVVTTLGAGSASTISGLPFACDLNASGSIDRWAAASAAYVFIGCRTNGSTVELSGITAANATIAITGAFASGTTIRGSVVYRTAN